MSDINGLFYSLDSLDNKLEEFNRLPVAPSNHVGIKCAFGHWAVHSNRRFARYSYHQNAYLCAHGHSAPARFERAAAQLSAQQYLADLDDSGLTSGVWFHSSPQSLDQFWYNLDANRFVHVGTYAAATDWEMIQCYPDQESHLFLVRLRDDALISPLIYVERDGSASLERRGSRLGEYDIYRYVNVKEDPGSVSLLVNPNTIAEAEVLEAVPAGGARPSLLEQHNNYYLPDSSTTSLRMK